jgi:hypothetical protein
MLRAGFEPATCRLGVENGNVAGPQQKERRGRGMRSGADSNRSEPAKAAHALPDNRAASARDKGAACRRRPSGRAGIATTSVCAADQERRLLLCARRQTRQDSNPDLRGWSSPCSRYTTGLRKRTTRLERAFPEWRPGALPTELHPHEEHARLESNQRPLPSQSSALSTELRA